MLALYMTRKSEVSIRPEVVPTEINVEKTEGVKEISVERKEEKVVSKSEMKNDVVPSVVVVEKNETYKETYQDQYQKLTLKGRSLTREERQEFYDFIRTGPNDIKTLYLKDVMMSKLERQGTKVSELIPEFIKIVVDRNLDGEMRGYVTQHLRTAYGRSDDVERGVLKEFFFRAVEDYESDVAGTALSAIVNLNDQFGDFDDFKIKEAALKLVTNEKTSVPSLITGLQLAGKLRLKEALPVARKMAKESSDLTLKVAAIYTLGQVGDHEDLAFLEEVFESKKETDAHFHQVADNSINKIYDRF